MPIKASSYQPADSSATLSSPVVKSASESAMDLLIQELGTRLRSGEPIRVEELLARNPGLADQQETAVRLIYEEMCVRRELGEDPSSEEYLLRFPQWRQSLQMVPECHRILEPDLAGPIYPAVSDTLGDFRLVAELGRGLQGRVFLATQPSLADRPVVLKLTPRSGRAHLSLARLQHTHIVPLFFVQEDSERRLLIVCMPYFGGATFAEILQALPEPRRGIGSGHNLLRTLDSIQSALPVSYPPRGRARHFLGQASAVQAICWIGPAWPTRCNMPTSAASFIWM
jgi:hypothetical protein